MNIFFLTLGAFAETPQKHALIVAVSEYKQQSITPLASEKDADWPETHHQYSHHA